MLLDRVFKARCHVCRREIEAGALCADSTECSRIRQSWVFSPCPVDRCEFPMAEHSSRKTGPGGEMVWTCPDGWGTRLTVS
jgi:hypothetical protein